MSGYLSQAVTNLVAAEKQISALSGLPAAAQKIQADSSATISPVITQIQGMQKSVTGFVQQATPELNKIEAMVSGNQPLPQIKTAIANVQTEASGLQTSVNETSAKIQAASSQVLGYFGKLATIESNITGQMTTLQGQLGNAQSEEEAAKKKYYYLLALGPFGLVGLAVALGLYLKWTSDVNGYENQIRSLNAQISSLNAMKSACQLMGTDFQGVVSKISGVKNSVNFLVSDILEVESDLDSGSPLPIIEIKVKAAITEVNTLDVDAS